MNKKQALALAKSLQAQAGQLVDFLDKEVNPPVPADPRVEIISRYLNGQGKVIIDAAREARLSLADACALVEQESKGRNIFEIGTPPEPWDGAPVTNPLVDRMIARPGYKTYDAQMWGVGLVQLTWPDYVISAHGRPGGAASPANQLAVGFGLLRGYLGRYPRERAFASYNAGERGWMNGRAYAAQVMAKARVWEERLGEDEPTDPDKPWIKIQAREEWSRGAGPYVAAHPTHYDLRPDVLRLAEKYINLPRFYKKVSANTYKGHPPGWEQYERVSVDFWAWEGRGFELADDLQEALTETIYDDPAPPLVEWMISNSRMWVRDGKGWRPAPVGPPDSDPKHGKHIHVSWRLEEG
jgi:hypothetical protein